MCSIHRKKYRYLFLFALSFALLNCQSEETSEEEINFSKSKGEGVDQNEISGMVTFSSLDPHIYVPIDNPYDEKPNNEEFNVTATNIKASVSAKIRLKKMNVDPLKNNQPFDIITEIKHEGKVVGSGNFVGYFSPSGCWQSENSVLDFNGKCDYRVVTSVTGQNIYIPGFWEINIYWRSPETSIKYSVDLHSWTLRLDYQYTNESP